MLVNSVIPTTISLHANSYNSWLCVQVVIMSRLYAWLQELVMFTGYSHVHITEREYVYIYAG